MLCRQFLEGALPPGAHGSTFGGNPLASAAALAVLETLEDEGLSARSVERGHQLAKLLCGLVEKHPGVVESTRGMGLLQALVLKESVDARGVVEALRGRGLLVTVAGGQALRFTPPLIVTEAELEEGVGILDEVLGGWS
jgi:acetylornithine/N-succinyldiaminopimelate aminotransferase